jgi:hypothetical protein
MLKYTESRRRPCQHSMWDLRRGECGARDFVEYRA